MDLDQFQDALGKLIAKARAAETIPINELIEVIDTEVEGLEMAQAEGEEF